MQLKKILIQVLQKFMVPRILVADVTTLNSPALHVIFGTSILLNSLPLSVCQILTSPFPPVAKSALVLRGKTMSFTALPWHVLRSSGEISAKLSKIFDIFRNIYGFLTNVYSVDVVFTCSTIYLMSITADRDGANATVEFTRGKFSLFQ